MRGPILLATRGSRDSKAAALVAKLISKRLGRTLNVCSVVEPALLYGLPPEGQATSLKIDHDASLARERDLQGAFTRLLGGRAGWNAEVRIGQPATEVCEAATESDASLIVVGSSPQKRARRIVAGKRATQILNRATSPVLAVAPWLKQLPTSAVAAIDFSPASVRAAQTALMIMEKGSWMLLVHVMPANYLQAVPTTADADLRAQVLAKLDEIRKTLQSGAPGIEISGTVLHGEPGAEILNHVESTDADLIATGTRGRSALARILVGSVATELFHGAPCSVLASPPPPKSEEFEMQLQNEGNALTTDASQFGALLDAFNQRNTGRRVAIEEDDREFGAQLQVDGYLLRGITWDHADRRVDIMLGRSRTGTVHLTRTIPDVSGIAVTGDGKGQDTALQLKHGKAQTILMFRGGETATEK